MVAMLGGVDPEANASGGDGGCAVAAVGTQGTRGLVGLALAGVITALLGRRRRHG
jgi:MYXO-CTERM domain-containing protein